MSEREWESDSSRYLTPTAAGEADAFTAIDPQRHRQQLVEVAETVPPPNVATALGLTAGATAIVRRRVMFIDGEPAETTDSYYPLDVAAGTPLAERRKIRGGAITALADLGHAVHDVVETVALGTVDNPARYGLTQATSALVLMRISRNQAGDPVEVSVMHMFAGQRLTYRTKAG